jgi:hypothetical protein
MRNAFLSVLVLSISVQLATAQDSVTISSDQRDLSRPVSTLINQIRKREKISITYEDPRYSGPADTEDVTAEVAKTSELEKQYGSRIIVPKGHEITFVYAPKELRTLSGARAVVERMLEEYTSIGGAAFAVVEDKVRLHVIPSDVLDSSGTSTHQASVLDNIITVPAAQRHGDELLQAICDEIQKQTGYEVGIGPSIPTNYLDSYQTREGIQKKKARTAIAELLDRASVPGIFDWDLYYDPADKAYMLNFAYVGQAGSVQKRSD